MDGQDCNASFAGPGLLAFARAVFCCCRTSGRITGLALSHPSAALPSLGSLLRSRSCHVDYEKANQSITFQNWHSLAPKGLPLRVTGGNSAPNAQKARAKVEVRDGIQFWGCSLAGLTSAEHGLVQQLQRGTRCNETRGLAECFSVLSLLGLAERHAAQPAVSYVRLNKLPGLPEAKFRPMHSCW